MLETYWNDVKRWAAHPYNEDGNLLIGFFSSAFGLSQLGFGLASFTALSTNAVSTLSRIER
jgi:hypothetical protein